MFQVKRFTGRMAGLAAAILLCLPASQGRAGQTCTVTSATGAYHA